MAISFGEPDGFTKFHLFLSKNRGGVNTGGGAIFPRDLSLTAAGGAVYDQGWGKGDTWVVLMVQGCESPG